MESLRRLYLNNKEKIVSVKSDFKDEFLNGPLLLNPSSFYDQKIKLFIVGQETKGWCCDSANFDLLFKTYSDFNLGENYYSSPFWNITRKIERIIGIDDYSCAWSNINRYDHNGKEPKGDILNAISTLDYLVKEEMTLLKPDVCFFFTNKKYDYRIQKLYPDLKVKKVDDLPFDHFIQIEHESMPAYTFRTPHPKTIRLKKWEEAFIDCMTNLLPKVHSTE